MIKIENDIKQFIENNPIAFSTVSLDKKPNVIGVAYVKVVADNQVVVTDNFMKQTKENIAANNNVCLAVWNKDWNGYKLVGTAEYFVNGDWKKYVEDMPENEGLSAKGAILITVSDLIKLG